MLPRWHKEKIDVPPYKFNIIDNTNVEDGRITTRNFKIGATYVDCVNVSVSYNKDNRPVSAKIPTLVYNEECSFKPKLLDRGEGTKVIIKTLLRYVHEQIPEISLFEFQDASTIECGTDEEQYRKRHRKPGTHAYPTVLYYFSLAFNGITWYEKHFHAYQKEGHEVYRAFVKEWLTTEEMKPDFAEFLAKANPSDKLVAELRTYYNHAKTYGEFFTSIPTNDRCRLVRSWIYGFMKDEMRHVFSDDNWVIDVTKIDESPEWSLASIKQGGLRRTLRKRSNKRSNKQKSSYYCPKGHVNTLLVCHDMGAEMN